VTTQQRRLRVVYVVPDLGVGGAERHVTELMSRLDRSRFAPSVVCIGEKGELFSALGDAGVSSVAFGRTKRQPGKQLLDLVRVFRNTRPDVVIVQGFNAEVVGRVAAVIARVPRVVLWVHNCDDIRPRTSARRVSDRVLDRVTDAYFGVAHGQVRYMSEELGYPEHKIRVIRNGVDPTQFHGTDRGTRAGLGLGEHDLVVGILAALRPEKDHETFLRAARVIAAEIPEARFLIVGGGQQRSGLELLAHELGVADRVVFAGVRHDVAAMLGSMDVFVLSSSTECFPIALLEAMASSRPAVCTSVGGIPEMIEEGVTGYLVPVKDPLALAERVTRLLRAPERRRQFGAAARERVDSHFTLNRSVQETERQLLDVASFLPEQTAAPGRLQS
jgi:glycosyltransferase involved in cell wall biosynthesis